jgi:hypothetical protein
MEVKMAHFVGGMVKTYRMFLAAAGIAALAMMSCTTFQASGFQMRADDVQDYQVLGDFSRKVWAHKFLGQSGGQTLFNISANMTDRPVRRAVEQEIRERGGTAAINIKVKWGSNPVQWILNYLTFNIWAPGTITVSGTVVKDKEKEQASQNQGDPPAIQQGAPPPAESGSAP